MYLLGLAATPAPFDGLVLAWQAQTQALSLFFNLRCSVTALQLERPRCCPGCSCFYAQPGVACAEPEGTVSALAAAHDDSTGQP